MDIPIQELVRKNIQLLAPYSSARTEFTGQANVLLDANENPFGTHNRYPDPLQTDLKKKLAAIKNINPNQIFLGNGSDEVIDLAFRIFCEPNKDKALTFVPTYGMYEVAANINAVQLIKLPLNSNFQMDKTNLQPFLSDDALKLILLCSPNNPTGNLLHTHDIEYILDNFNGIVLIDEAYIDFCKQPSFTKRIKAHPKLIVIQTLSKAWGLAGLRVGIAFMHEQVLFYFNKVKAPYNIGSLHQQAVLEALGKEAEFYQNIKTVIAEKEKMVLRLQEFKSIQKIHPSDANFLLVEVEDANMLYKKLMKKRIIIRNRDSVVKNCLRITIGTPQENEQLINALKEITHG
jgi:histidinol-phosphate aminotransferase